MWGGTGAAPETHAPVRAPHGEHAGGGPGRALGLSHSPVAAGHSLAPASAQTTARGTPTGSRLKLGSSRRVPRIPRPSPAPARADRTARPMMHALCPLL